MISYAPLFDTLKAKDVSTYKLIHDYGISRSLIDRLKHDKSVTTATINTLCSILNCRVDEIVIYTPDVDDNNSFSQK